ncbi:MAG: sensor histidine kinase, partial [Bacteroidetes bacterium]|nr:sensor histidine kinase [Bacteroidota bacterium]
LRWIADTHMKLGDYEQALTHYLRYVRHSDRSGDQRGVADGYYRLSLVYEKLLHLEKALEYARLSDRLYTAQGRTEDRVMALQREGGLLVRMNRDDEALRVLKAAQIACENAGNTHGLAIVLNKMTLAYEDKSDFKTALAYHRQAIALLEDANDKWNLARAWHNYGSCLMKHGDDSLARDAFDRGIALARETGSLDALMDIENELRREAARRGDYLSAYRHHMLFTRIKDSLYRQESIRSMNEMLARFDSERKDQQIAMYKKDGQLRALDLQRQREELLRRRLEAERREQDLLVLSQESEIQALKLHDNEIAMRMEKAQRQKTQREAELLQQSDLLKEEKLARQRLLLAALAVGATLLAVIGLLLLRRARAKRLQASLRAEAAEARELVARSEAERTKRKMQNLFTKKLIESQELERRRIAAELHDGLGQELLVIGNQAELALMEQDVTRTRQSLSRISALARNVIMEVRQVSRDLRPIQLERAGLSETLIDTLNRISLATGIRFTSDIGDLEGLLAPEQEIHLFRIVQEGVNNILKHSQANAASVAVTPRDDVLVVRIEDDGRGFALHSHLSKHGSDLGFGLHGMKERVEMLHGDMRIHSAVNRGTTIEVRVPLTIPTPTPREKESIPV